MAARPTLGGLLEREPCARSAGRHCAGGNGSSRLLPYNGSTRRQTTALSSLVRRRHIAFCFPSAGAQRLRPRQSYRDAQPYAATNRHSRRAVRQTAALSQLGLDLIGRALDGIDRLGLDDFRLALQPRFNPQPKPREHKSRDNAETKRNNIPFHCFFPFVLPIKKPPEG